MLTIILFDNDVFRSYVDMVEMNQVLFMCTVDICAAHVS